MQSSKLAVLASLLVPRVEPDNSKFSKEEKTLINISSGSKFFDPSLMNESDDDDNGEPSKS